MTTTVVGAVALGPADSQFLIGVIQKQPPSSFPGGSGT